MTQQDTGLNLRAGSKKGGGDESDSNMVSWKVVSSFSLKSLEKIALEIAPVLSAILNAVLFCISMVKNQIRCGTVLPIPPLWKPMVGVGLRAQTKKKKGNCTGIAAGYAGFSMSST
ncbi:hypothetical protein BDZ97DRAFT_1766445 [Flammula alnicola]|nr:hypothetical protein BDZ97DRAFT_1766445 [Flammula alnicola]